MPNCAKKGRSKRKNNSTGSSPNEKPQSVFGRPCSRAEKAKKGDRVKQEGKGQKTL